MKKEFEMSDLGLLSYYLGIAVSQKKWGISLRQTAYARKILEQFGLLDCNPTKSPMEPKLKVTKDEEGEEVDPTEYRRVVGCLRYLTHTRPDLSFSVGIASRFMEKPTTLHFQVVKHILRYVKGTIDYGINYEKGREVEDLVGFSDSDHGGDKSMQLKEDILSRFLQMKYKDQKYLRDIILNYVLAGKDPVGISMSWFIYLLCKHPEVQDKVAMEIKEATNMKGKFTNVADFASYVSEGALKNMQYLHAALTETIRARLVRRNGIKQRMEMQRKRITLEKEN
ncbi:hypothetical protein LXL04_022774 [Taraxacum kok-saghyz]